jgi:hypothetical protein
MWCWLLRREAACRHRELPAEPSLAVADIAAAVRRVNDSMAAAEARRHNWQAAMRRANLRRIK